MIFYDIITALPLKLNYVNPLLGIGKRAKVIVNINVRSSSYSIVSAEIHMRQHFFLMTSSDILVIHLKSASKISIY